MVTNFEERWLNTAGNTGHRTKAEADELNAKEEAELLRVRMAFAREDLDFKAEELE